MSQEAAAAALGAALLRLRDAVIGTRFPLALPGADAARRKADDLAAQLDDYLMPRLAHLDAPMLVVVGGPAGVGKSTLVNSVVGAPISAAGVLPATARPPVLVCAATDAPWFGEPYLLPGLPRGRRDAEWPQEVVPIEVVMAPTLPPGLALLDAPAADSVVAANRTLAVQLASAADLLIFVTTASRYADASWWSLLRTARDRGAALAVVLDRVPTDTAADVTGHLAEMLTAQQLGTTPLLVIPASRVDAHGLLSEDVVAQLYDWLFAIAADDGRRTAVVRRTLDSAIAAAAADALRLAGAADAHTDAARALREAAGAAYVEASTLVAEGIAGGALLRGEVLARWEELVDTGVLPRALQARGGGLRGRLSGPLAERGVPGQEFRKALADGIAALVLAVATDAAEQSAAAWREHSAGAALLVRARAEAAGTGRVADVGLPAPELEQQVKALVAHWRADVAGMVASAAGDQPPARAAAYAIATDLLVTVAVVVSSPPAGLSRTARRLLAKVLADQAVVSLAGQARDALLERVDSLLFSEQDRFSGLLAAERVSSDAAGRLRDAVYEVAHCRDAAMLTDGMQAQPLLLPEPTEDSTNEVPEPAADTAAADEDPTDSVPTEAAVPGDSGTRHPADTPEANGPAESVADQAEEDQR